MSSKRIKGITIEIEGDTTKLNDALKEMDKSLSSTQSALRDVNKLLKLDPTNTTLLSQKQKLLADAIETTENRLKKLEKAQEQAKKALTDKKIGQDEYDALEREIEDTRISLKNYEKQADKVEQQQKELAGATQEVKEETKDFGIETLSTMESLDKIGGVLSDVSGKLVDFGRSAIDARNEFDDAFDTIQYATGRTNEEVEALNGILTDIVRTIPVDDMGDLATAIGDVATRTKLSDDEIETFMISVAELAKMSGESSSKIVDDAISIAETYGVSYGEALEVMHTAGQAFALTFDEIGNGAENAGLILHNQLGLSLEQVTGLMGLMKSQGLDANTAITGLVKATMSMSKDGTVSIEAMNEVLAGLSDGTISLSDATDIFGAKAGNFITFLQESGITSVEDLSSAYAEMAEQGMSVSEMYDEMYDAGDEVTVAQQNLNESLATLGETLLTSLAPTIESVIGWIQGLAEWWQNLGTDGQNLIITIGEVVAILGIVISTITSLSGAITAIHMLIALNPIGLAITAIAGVIAILTVLWNNCEGFRNFVTSAIDAVVNAFSESWEAIKSSTQTLIDTIKTLFDGAYTAVTNIWNGITGFFTGIWDGIAEPVSGMWEGIKNTFSGAIDTIKGFFNFQWEWPHIPLPHFSISGSINPLDWFSQGLPSVGVEWYAKAMNQPYLLDGATIFGMQNGKLLGGGETGAEVIMGKSLYDRMASGVNLNVVVNASEGMNESELADRVIDRITYKMNRAGATW